MSERDRVVMNRNKQHKNNTSINSSSFKVFFFLKKKVDFQ